MPIPVRASCRLCAAALAPALAGSTQASLAPLRTHHPAPPACAQPLCTSPLLTSPLRKPFVPVPPSPPPPPGHLDHEGREAHHLGAAGPHVGVLQAHSMLYLISVLIDCALTSFCCGLFSPLTQQPVAHGAGRRQRRRARSGETVLQAYAHGRWACFQSSCVPRRAAAPCHLVPALGDQAAQRLGAVGVHPGALPIDGHLQRRRKKREG